VVQELVSLNSLLAGQSARVGKIVGRADHVHRLEEFGIRGGTKVQMFQPGNPCIVRLAGSKFCLRADDLLRVFVRPS